MEHACICEEISARIGDRRAALDKGAAQALREANDLLFRALSEEPSRDLPEVKRLNQRIHTLVHARSRLNDAVGLMARKQELLMALTGAREPEGDAA
jgi:hypothetical protein